MYGRSSFLFVRSFVLPAEISLHVLWTTASFCCLLQYTWYDVLSILPLVSSTATTAATICEEGRTRRRTANRLAPGNPSKAELQCSANGNIWHAIPLCKYVFIFVWTIVRVRSLRNYVEYLQQHTRISSVFGWTVMQATSHTFTCSKSVHVSYSLSGAGAHAWPTYRTRK